MLAAKGQSAFGQDQDDLVMIPFTTAERKVLGVAAPTQAQTQNNWLYPPPPNPYNLTPRLTGYVNMIYVQADEPEPRCTAAIAEATQTLTRRHRIKPGQINDFAVRNLSQIAETAESSSRIMALLLAAVASISLVVGGIGIMNILLVSVTERTREIGLRMAIGARRLHVLLQFLAEAVFLSVTGGVAGIVVGRRGRRRRSPLIFGWPAPISLTAIVGGFLFSAAVGIFFGYYPARKGRPARSDRGAALRVMRRRIAAALRQWPARSVIEATPGRESQAGLHFDRQRLQGERAIEAADERVGAEPGAQGDRGVGPDVVARQRPAPRPGGRREHRPRQNAPAGLTDVEAEFPDRAVIAFPKSMRRRVDAPHFLGGRDDHAQSAGDVAAQGADLDVGLGQRGLREGGQGDQRDRKRWDAEVHLDLLSFESMRELARRRTTRAHRPAYIHSRGRRRCLRFEFMRASPTRRP